MNTRVAEDIPSDLDFYGRSKLADAKYQRSQITAADVKAAISPEIVAEITARVKKEGSFTDAS